MITSPPAPAVAYLRRSTDKQEQSLADQRSEIRRFASEHGYTIIDEYCDDAISGTSAKGRRGFQRMIEDAKRGEFRAVIVWNSDRFSRGDVTETEHFRYLLRAAGVAVLSVTEDYLHRDGIDGDILRTVKQFQNRQFSISLSQSTLRGQVSSVLAASDPGRMTPYGYDREIIGPDGTMLYRVRFLEGGERATFDRHGALQATYSKGQTLRKPGKECTARLVLSEAGRVSTVRDIFTMCIDGVGFKGIADELNRRGLMSPKGRLWSFTTIKAMLENPVYRGDVVWNRRSESKFYRVRDGRADAMRPREESGRVERTVEDDWIVMPDAVPAIVDRETWDLAQVNVLERAKAKGGTGKQTNRWLLSGVLRCGDCGHGYWGERKRKGHKAGRSVVETSYYACSGRRGRGKVTCPHPAHVRADDLEAWVLGKLSGLVMIDDLTVDAAVDRLVETASLRTADRDNIDRLDIELAEIDATVNALLTGLDPANLPLVNDRLTQLRRRKEQLQRERRVAKTASRPFDELAIRRWATERISGLADAIDGRRNEHVRRVLTSYVDEIVIWPSTKTGILRVNAFAAGLQNDTDRPEVGRSCVDEVAGAQPSSGHDSVVQSARRIVLRHRQVQRLPVIDARASSMRATGNAVNLRPWLLSVPFAVKSHSSSFL